VHFAYNVAMPAFYNVAMPALFVVTIAQEPQRQAICHRQPVPACGDKLNRCITGPDPYTANLDHARGQDPKRSPATTESLRLEAHS
jgi:hypothetical protein